MKPTLSRRPIFQIFILLILQTITSTIIVLVTAEFLPKALVQLNPNRFLDITLAPMLILYILLYVPTQIILFFSYIILKLFGSSQEQSARVFSKVDLEHYVDELSSRIKDEEEFSNEMLILRNALDFSNIKARDCMIPRTEIIGVEIEENSDEAKKLLIDKGLSKLIVYRDDIDNIIGYIHSFDYQNQIECHGQSSKEDNKKLPQHARMRPPTCRAT